MPAKTKTKSKCKATGGRTKSPCNRCASLCCKELVLCIEKPKDEEDAEFLRWQLQYDTVSIAINNHKWHTVTQGNCIYLTKDLLCSIYERRPQKCRRHNPPECERFGPWYDIRISTPEELDAHLAAEKAKRRRKRARKK